MANDGTVDQQQLQATINEAYQTVSQMVAKILSAAQVVDNRKLGDLSLYSTIEAAINAGQLGSAANVRAGIGFDAAIRNIIGGFGLGLTSPNYISNPDDINLPNGFYTVNASDFSNPPNSSGIVFLEQCRAAGTGYQRVRSSVGAYAKVRTLDYDNGHGQWLSDPEWGSNSSGMFLKLPSGDAIATGTVARIVNITAQNDVSGGYRCFSEAVTFPMTFSSAPQVIPTNVYSGQGYLMDLSVTPLSSSKTGTNLSWSGASSRPSQPVSANYFAFGRYV
jgi:hypothetical protein